MHLPLGQLAHELASGVSYWRCRARMVVARPAPGSELLAFPIVDVQVQRLPPGRT